MRTIRSDSVSFAVRTLCLKANRQLRPDVLRALKSALARESSPRAVAALKLIVENARLAKARELPICQDTGLPVVFCRLGRRVRIEGDLAAAVQKGITWGYRDGSFRASIVADPLCRGKCSFGPGIVHLEFDAGDKLRLQLLPKGFGCENKTSLKMFNPTASMAGIRDFLVETVRSAGGDACPPYVLGVGIGGTPEYAGLLAKKALLRPLGCPAGGKAGKLAREALDAINILGIGPMGTGGRTTCLGVNIETFPTHIAGLPVAVSVSCHALRSASVTL